MQQLLRPLRERVATAQPLAALPLTDAACPLRASGTRGKRSWSNASLHPDALRTIRHGTAVGGTAEGPSVPEGKAKSEQAPIRRPPYSNFARTCKVAAKSAFSLTPGAARSLFGADQKRMGGASPLDKPPCGSRDPVAAVRRPASSAQRMFTGPPATAAWTCTGARPARGRAPHWEWCGAGCPPPPGPGW